MFFNDDIKTISKVNTLKIPIFADENINKELKYKSLFNVTESIPKPVSIETIVISMKNNNLLDNEIKTMIDDMSNCQNIFFKKIQQELFDNKNLNIKRKRYKNKKKGMNSLDVKEKKLLGRKTNNDSTIRIHNKFSMDNIINKIKNILKRSLLSFINKVIYNTYDIDELQNLFIKLNLSVSATSYIVKDIDYKCLANKKNKKDNLELLKLSIKDFLSQNISTRYKSLDLNSSQCNKTIINFLCSDLYNKDLFNFIFNKLNFGDWLNIFIYNKNINDYPEYNSLAIKHVLIINKSLIGIDSFLKELSEDKDYLYCFILLIYNYKRYFSIKSGRKGRKMNNN